MSSRWLNESNLSPFFICCAGAWQGQAGKGRRRSGGTGDTGEQEQPWDRSICSPNHPVSSSHPNPGKVDLFWVGESHTILVGEHGRAARHPQVPGTTSPPPWCHLHLPCHILHMQNPKRCYSEVTQLLLQLCWL